MWCKACARALETTAEGDLLLEEMRCVAASHGDRKSWWEWRVNRGFSDHPDYLEGANAFANRQASICQALQAHCNKLAKVMEMWFSGGWVDYDAGASLESLTSPTLAEGNSLWNNIKRSGAEELVT